MTEYKPVIGLEIHVELKTKSKMFCQCSADYFGKKPNTNTCPVCLGLPGALPVPNRLAVEWSVLIGLALNCSINHNTKFDRKNYFYPDLPKGYQISQYDEPFAIKGSLKVRSPKSEVVKEFRVHRVHLEEDTGKLLHEGKETKIDFNRSGVPLVEIVTEPDFDNADDVKAFLEELHTIIEYLGVSDADMEKGSMRMEPNISLRIVESRKSKVESNNEYLDPKDLPKYKVEVKNINSFNFVKKAVEYELKRQQEILEKGELPAQETRGYDEKTETTYSQRSKEEAHDYRYFPEPDIPPMKFENDYILRLKSKLPELPAARVARYVQADGLKQVDAIVLTKNKSLGDYYELVKTEAQATDLKKQAIANLIINKKIPISLSAKEFVKKAAEKSQPITTDLNILSKTILSVIEKNPKAAADYRNGKENALMFLLGQIMREMKGKADANVVREELKKAFKNE